MLEVRHVTKEYAAPGGTLRVLAGVDLEVLPGDAVAVTGPSGSGKSTLLYVLGGLEPPTSGAVTLDGKNPYAMAERDAAAFRNRHIGFVFQDHCLLPQCTVLENVLVPSLVAPPGPHHERARELLTQVGLRERLHHRPSELSGGEKQRVAIARALLLGPRLVLCDEPTGNLDPPTADSVATLLLELQAAQRNMLIVVTHSRDLAARLPRRFEMARDTAALRPF